MGERLRAALLASTVVALLAFGTASASAVSASVSPAGGVSAIGTVTFTGGSTSIRCPLTLLTSLSSGPIRISLGEGLGSVGRVTIGPCEGGEVAGVLFLAWPITINDSLPTRTSLTTTNATGLLVKILDASFLLGVFGGFVQCLYGRSAAALLTLTPTEAGSSRYTARSLTLLTTPLSLVSGGFGCPFEGHFAGTLTLSFTQTVTLI